jgi:uncharacterized membrane protein
MESLLHQAGRVVALALETIAIAIIAIGTIESLINISRAWLMRSRGVERRTIWLDLAGWLVAAMTFQLGADIVATSFSPGWDEIERLGAVAAIRTFLSYFLDREVENTRRLQRASAGDATLKRTA